MSYNSLQKAKSDINNEFFTLLSDIEKELPHHSHHFNNKIIYCNCDNHLKSQFLVYFKANFHLFGIKKLILTNYISNKFSLFGECISYTHNYYEYDGYEEYTKNLYGDGDFRSKECVDILKLSDIIITNPPFSLFRELLPIIIENKKDFLILGNNNAITQRYTFNLFRQHKLYIGYNSPHYAMTPDGQLTQGAQNSWYTSFECIKPFYTLINEDFGKFDKIDGFDIININLSKDIPKNYYGLIGVPISFAEKINFDQFELISITDEPPYIKVTVNGKRIYRRLILKLKKY